MLKSRDTTRQMREHWDQFARRDALFFVACNRRDWSTADFLEHGRDLVDDVVAWAGAAGGRRALEIGCGPGRMLVHLARYFDDVLGIDVSPEMLERTKTLSLPTNVEVALGDGATLGAAGDSAYDLVLSFQVFQHIPDETVVASYLRETARVLVPGGHAVLQIDTRPRSLLAQTSHLLPDRMLPVTRRSYMRRYRRSADGVRRLILKAGLQVEDERGAGTADHLLLAGPAPGGHDG